MKRTPRWMVPAWLTALGLASCKGEPDPTPWCSDAGGSPADPLVESPTYYRDIKPILDQKCARCHEEGGHSPFNLTTYEDAFLARDLVATAITARTMPPFLAEGCCQDYFQDFSLTAEEIATIVRWVDTIAPEGDPAAEPPPSPPIGGLSRVDVSVAMPSPYVPQPVNGTSDDNRCFVADWPIDHDAFVTGVEPKPGNRAIVHHIIVGALGPDDADEVIDRDEADPGPGFDCNGGFGDLQDVVVLGGSLLGGDFPRGIGTQVEAGSKIVFNIHYSTVQGAGEDLTTIDFRIDPEAREAKGIAIANPAWLIDDAMGIEAGDPDAVFFFAFEPDLFTRDEDVLIENVTPHMHAFGSKFRVLARHEDGTTTCLLEIADWDFGWQQPFWLAEPIPLGQDDELYIECHFDNSAANQPDGGPPRDIAWGSDNQDMCAGFLAFTEAP